MNNKHTKDILADILTIGELGSHIICRPLLPAPWGLIFTPEDKAYFHIIKTGDCFFYPDKKNNPITLYQGDILFVPKVNDYRISSSKKVKGRNYIDEINRVAKLSNKNVDKTTQIICGSYNLTSNMSLPFFSLLPSYIHITNEDMSRFPELGLTIQTIIREDSTNELGSDFIIARLIDILLVQLIRFWLENYNSESVGWLPATLNIELRRVLSIIHERPNEKWTAISLAKEAGISRTKLFTTFTKVVGVSPIQYLTNWRIDLSKKLLTTSSLSIQEISNSVGYESEASFGRVFKKVEKTSPGKFRNSFVE